MLNISYRDITGEVCCTGTTATKAMISSLPNEIQDQDKDNTIIGVSSAGGLITIIVIIIIIVGIIAMMKCERGKIL